MQLLDPAQEAAVAQIHVEVLEETPLCFIGRSFDLARTAETQTPGVIGWPFASWALLAWLDAGLIDVCFDAGLNPDAELQSLGWSERADSRHGYLALRADDARALLTDIPRWHASRNTGRFYPLRTDATDDLQFEQWMLSACQSLTPAPQLGANPELLDSVAWQNSRAPWEDITQGRKLYVVRLNTGNDTRWARVLADSRRQVLAVNPDFAVWPERLAEWSTDLAEQVAVVKTWVPTLITNEIEFREIG